MNPAQRNQSPPQLPPSYTENFVQDAVSGNCIDHYPLAEKMLILRYRTCKAIVDGDHNQALKALAGRIELGEKISSGADNLEGRVLQGDWQHAKRLAVQRVELLRRNLSEHIPGTQVQFHSF